MLHSIHYTLVLAVSSIILLAHQASAQCCHHCGLTKTCTKVCRLVVDEKSVEVVCWGCEREDFCVPGPSTSKCSKCSRIECDCLAGLNKKVISKPKKFVWTEWLPGTATIRTKKKLMKRTTTKKIPSYKWVTEQVCDQCARQLDACDLIAGQSVPSVPAEYAGLPQVCEPQR